MGFRGVYFIFFYLFFISASAQLVTTNNTSITSLVEQFKGDDCIQISNASITQSGVQDGFISFGGFQNNSTNFPFSNGIILANGAIANAGNTAITANLNDGTTEWIGDNDLENILNISNTYNATVLEFDILTMGDQLSFEYLLASEEYLNENPCNHSDYFAAFIKPADNSSGYSNMALIPNTNEVVGTGNIHPQIIGFCNAQNEEYFEGYSLGNTNYNGRTTPITALATIIPNTQYHIKIVIADQGDTDLDTAVFLKNNSLTTSLDIGEDITTCEPEYTIAAPFEMNNATYHWYLDGNILPETGASLTATESGVYTLEIIPNAFESCIVSGEINLSINENLETNEVTDFIKCDGFDQNGISSFDLTTKSAELIDAMVESGSYSISYFLSENDANTNNNSISTNFTNTENPQTIFARVENNTTGCKAINSFNILVNNAFTTLPTAPDLEVCDYNADGFVSFNFTSTRQFYTNQFPNTQVQLFTTIQNAEAGVSSIPNTYQNTENPQTVYIKVTPDNGSCPAYSSITITAITNVPLLNINTSLNACVEETEFSTFDLTNALPNILDTPSNPNYEISYHLNQNQAINNLNAIADPENFTNTQPFQQTVYVRIQDTQNNNGCFSIATITVYTDELSYNANTHYYACDDSSNDGITNFNLLDVANFITNGNSNYSVDFYLDENNPSAILDSNTPFENTSNPQTVYASISSENCSSTLAIELEVSPYFSIEAPSEPFEFCDTNQDLATTVFFGSFTPYFTNGNNYTVIYYTSFTNAENQVSSILYEYYNNAQMTFYARVTDNLTGCYDIVPFSVNILPAPITYTPNDIYFCDDNNDGIYTFNLTTVIPEVVTSTENRSFEFYTTASDANNSTNEISNPESYTSETDQIIVKIINTETGCFQLRSFNINVISFDEDAIITNLHICETDADGTEPILLQNKDDEITNGQTSVEVSYFENEPDATNNLNAIDKSTTYNATNQTIYARAQNIFDAECYYIYSFDVIISEEPDFLAPDENYNLCDDVSGDHIETFDFTEISNSILSSSSQNITFDFYLSEADANLEENALPLTYNNIQNPQTIYGKVKSENGCEVIFPMNLNVIQVADFQVPEPYVFCDNDYDGTMIFDITAQDFGALPERLDNLDIHYYHSLNDAELAQNSFENTQNYPVTNHDIIYISITNIISGCNIIYPVDITVNIPPEILLTNAINICENDDALIYLSDYNTQVFENPEDLEISYYENLADVENQTNPLDDALNYSENNFSLYVYAENLITGCNTTGSVSYQINPLPEISPVPDFSVCSDDDIYQQDLSYFGNIAAQFITLNNYEISYFHSEEDVLEHSNNISNWTDYPTQNNEEIFIKITNTITGCFDYTSFINYLIPSPVIPINEDFVICPETTPLIISAATGNNTDTYLWSTNATTSEISITTPGVYSVTVTNEIGCIATKYFGVSTSEPATIQDIETTGFPDNNTILVTVNGTGNYMFSLDGGIPQSSNLFTNILMGAHSVAVIDLNGCETTLSKPVIIFGFPTYFTPNGDGVNDTWNVFGFDEFSNSQIYIFDRYGKLLKTLLPGENGWDGTYRGEQLPPSDYWFKAIINDTEIPFEQNGHFSLKR